MQWTTLGKVGFRALRVLAAVVVLVLFAVVFLELRSIVRMTYDVPSPLTGAHSNF